LIFSTVHVYSPQDLEITNDTNEQITRISLGILINFGTPRVEYTRIVN